MPLDDSAAAQLIHLCASARTMLTGPFAEEVDRVATAASESLCDVQCARTNLAAARQNGEAALRWEKVLSEADTTPDNVDSIIAARRTARAEIAHWAARYSAAWTAFLEAEPINTAAKAALNEVKHRLAKEVDGFRLRAMPAAPPVVPN